MTKEFINEEDREKYLQLCEELFSIAEDFNREEHNDEAFNIKLLFQEITKDLSEKDNEELQDRLNCRGL